MTSSKYEAICKELDILTITYLNKLNEYNQQWKETSEQFQQGFLDLAHAKYTMGARTISRYSYDERMKATLQVEIDEEKKAHSKILPPPITEKVEKDSEKDKEKEGLRKRNTHEPEKKKNSDWIVKEEKEESEQADDIELHEKKSKKKIKKSRDPLHWFGLFVSSSLRTSQDHFKLATERIVSQVNIINELKELENRYHELQEEKLTLKLKEISIEQQKPEENIVA